MHFYPLAVSLLAEVRGHGLREERGPGSTRARERRYARVMNAEATGGGA